MKFTPKQIEDTARVMGTLATAAASGTAIGLARPEQVAPSETVVLASLFVVLYLSMLFIRRN